MRFRAAFFMRPGVLLFLRLVFLDFILFVLAHLY